MLLLLKAKSIFRIGVRVEDMDLKVSLSALRVCACVRAYMHACMFVSVCLYVPVCMCVCKCVYVTILRGTKDTTVTGKTSS